MLVSEADAEAWLEQKRVQAPADLRTRLQRIRDQVRAKRAAAKCKSISARAGAPSGAQTQGGAS